MNTNCTSGQMKLILKTFEDKKMTPDRLQAVLSSGIFADLCDRSADLRWRNSVRAVLNLGIILPTSFTLSIDYRQSIGEMIAAAQFHQVDPDIWEESWPSIASGVGYDQVEAKIFDFGDSTTGRGAVVKMKQAGWEPGRLEHLLAFAKDHIGELGRTRFVALGSVTDKNQPCVPIMESGHLERRFDLAYLRDDFGVGERFLGVRTPPMTPKT